jgi:hypothetical protein
MAKTHSPFQGKLSVIKYLFYFVRQLIYRNNLTLVIKQHLLKVEVSCLHLGYNRHLQDRTLLYLEENCGRILQNIDTYVTTQGITLQQTVSFTVTAAKSNLTVCCLLERTYENYYKILKNVVLSFKFLA